MKKIPTLFVRDETDRSKVLPSVTPGCEWVTQGYGTATRKFDGTCVRFDGTQWWARREVKPGKLSPPHWLHVESDTITGKSVGWEPIAQSSFSKAHADALNMGGVWQPGTYELCGEKVNGNPEGCVGHVLVRHGHVELGYIPRTYQGVRDWLIGVSVEGIVWHHPDGRMAKIKRRDFRS